MQADIPLVSHFDDPLAQKLRYCNSRLAGFYKYSIEQRWQHIQQYLTSLGGEDIALLESYIHMKNCQTHTSTNSLANSLANKTIENAIGSMHMPLGIATNFRINGLDILIPMCTEEPSVIAAASHGAKLMRHGSGITTLSSEPITTAQIQLTFESIAKKKQAIHKLLQEHKTSLLNLAKELTKNLKKRGGGARDIEWYINEPIKSLTVHVHIHTADAMGANIANHVAEKLASDLQNLFPKSKKGLRILTNLSLKRMVKAQCSIALQRLHKDQKQASDLASGIESAYSFAKHDIFRATTHNKGIMNGIDAVALATGNDWRAIEAGAHAFASLSGTYQPLSKWQVDKDSQELKGSLFMPLSVGTVGGMTKWHPVVAKLSLHLLGFPSAQQLAEIMAATGLAQNFSALRSLAGEGIQRGHMALHHKKASLV